LLGLPVHAPDGLAFGLEPLLKKARLTDHQVKGHGA
jgi:hypothetical protein